jgi:hypothetical protein
MVGGPRSEKPTDRDGGDGSIPIPYYEDLAE